MTRAARQWADPDESARELKRARCGPPARRIDRSFVADLRNFLKARNVLGRGKR